MFFGEVQDRNAPIDFRQQMWGHALHAWTMEAVARPPIDPKSLPWWKRHRIAGTEKLLDLQETAAKVRRYSFLCHTSVYPTIGKKVIWKSEAGDREGTIYQIEPCRDPRDMFKLFVVVTGEGTPS